MPGIAGLNAFVTTPLALTFAGALAALIVGLLVWRRTSGPLLLSLAMLLLAALAAGALIEQVSLSQQAAGRRALIARAEALERSAFGSALTCLDAGAGETVEDNCEKAVFASPQAAAAAVAYMGAWLQLLQDGAALEHDSDVTAALAPGRRAVERDRYGAAAQALASRDACTPTECPAFALVSNADTLKANLKAQLFQQYVSRYASAWNMAPEKAPAAAQAPAAAAAPTVGELTPAPIKPGEPWDFPSAKSIPPVNIMTPEPSLPKTGDNAVQPTPATAPQATAPAPQAAAPQAAASTPLPPKRPAAKPPLNLSGAGN